MKINRIPCIALGALLMAQFVASAQAAISFQISEMPAGITEWTLLSSDTTFTVGQFSSTGNYGEEIILPKSAFSFDYSQSFIMNFSSSIGRIKNLTTGTSVPLNFISYSKNQDLLQIFGGVLDHAVGNKLQITDFSTATVDIPFADIAVISPTAYSVSGAWQTDSQINISTVAIPEPASVALMASGIAAMACVLRRKKKNTA